MKLTAVLAAVFAAGILASFAIAKPPPGRGHDRHGAPPAAAVTVGDSTATTGTDSTDTTSTDTTATGTTTTSVSGRVTICHRTGSRSNPWVRLTLPARAAAKRLAHGDVPPVDGKCPAPKRHPRGGDDDGTTTGATTTGETTTAETTTAAATTTAP
jgi:hypothetical protein